MPKEESHVLHNITQYFIVPILIYVFSVRAFPSLNKTDVFVVSFFASLFPDIDHINIWFEYKFKDFQSFVRFLTKARRYRYSFLVFHNVAAMAIIVLLIPITFRIQPLAGIFLFAFLVHLLLDFFDDKMSIGRVTHWRYRRIT
jgi:hypothetical protein